MAKGAGRANDKSSSRPRHSRPNTATCFVDGDVSSDGIENSGDEDGNNENEGADTMLNIIQEIQKHKAKKTTIVSNTFQNAKVTLYAKARKNAYDAARDGNEYLDQALENMKRLKSQEGSYKKHLKDFVPLYDKNDESIQSLLAMYPNLLEDLVPRRTEEIDAASNMVMLLSANREASRKRLMCNARAQIDEGLENQQVATDAAALIKHYKALLLS